jgi:hypothetical protein
LLELRLISPSDRGEEAMKSATGFCAAALLALLTACGGGEEVNNSGVTAEESLALNEAENMLDASPDSLTATEDAPLGNGEMPAAETGNTGDLPVTGNEAANPH